MASSDIPPSNIDRQISVAKKCTKCCRSFPNTTDYFYRAGKGRLNARCKECERRDKKEQRAKDPQRFRDRNRRYYEANKSADCARAKRNYYARHEDNLIRKRRYYIKNQKLECAKNKFYRNKNSEKIREKNLKRSKRTKSFEYLWDKDYAEHAMKVCKGHCLYCGIILENDLFRAQQYDHIVPLNNPKCPGTVPWNFAPVCSRKINDGKIPGCNQSGSSQSICFLRNGS